MVLILDGQARGRPDDDAEPQVLQRRLLRRVPHFAWVRAYQGRAGRDCAAGV